MCLRKREIEKGILSLPPSPYLPPSLSLSLTGVTHVSEDTSTSSDKEAVEANQGTMALYRGHPQKVGELLKILEVAKVIRRYMAGNEITRFDQTSADR